MDILNKNTDVKLEKRPELVIKNNKEVTNIEIIRHLKSNTKSSLRILNSSSSLI